MAMLVAPSAELVFNNRHVASGHSCGDKPVCTSQNLTCGGIVIYYPMRVAQSLCTGLVGVLYTKILCYAKVGLRIDWREMEFRSKVKQADRKWNPKGRVWEMRYDRVVELGLEERIVEEGSI
jgi:hypothetical protein